ncbi:nucleotidyltransferase family protein [Myxococcota bacterium]|nr:nucleotidyltransferase family protein [Myxococcota bacterium]
MTSRRTQTSRRCEKKAEDEVFISGIVLAAGASTRMKAEGPKQLLRLDHRTLLQHVLDHALAAQFDELILVLGHRAQDIRKALTQTEGTPLRIVIAEDYLRGQSRSLWAGLAAANSRATGAAVLLGDQPDVDAPTINRVLRAWKKNCPPLLRPQYESQSGRNLPGPPVVIHRSVWPTVESLRHDQGAREIIRQHPDWLETLPISGHRPSDLDTPDDWKEWLASH